MLLNRRSTPRRAAPVAAVRSGSGAAARRVVCKPELQVISAFLTGTDGAKVGPVGTRRLRETPRHFPHGWPRARQRQTASHREPRTRNGARPRGHGERRRRGRIPEAAESSGEVQFVLRDRWSDRFRESGFSKDRHLARQITIGRLTGQDGSSLMVSAPRATRPRPRRCCRTCLYSDEVGSRLK
jgi:hypothetical protein